MTDNFSIGGGVMPLFLIGGLPTPVWVNPKLSIPVVDDQVNIGAGALMGTILGENEANFGIVYGISTLGNKDRNFSLGVGYGYAGGDWARRPTITASAMIRTSARGYFLTENYFIGTAASPLIIASVGGRRMIKSTGLDFGFFHP
ncbi:MAG TPA: hypothetical protein PKC24_04565 [Cyclobacteriaceae bacterium]|nr:hypothetical protein [Cyclobacteriaceae bacterium]